MIVNQIVIANYSLLCARHKIFKIQNLNVLYAITKSVIKTFSNRKWLIFYIRLPQKRWVACVAAWRYGYFLIFWFFFLIRIFFDVDARIRIVIFGRIRLFSQKKKKKRRIRLSNWASHTMTNTCIILIST